MSSKPSGGECLKQRGRGIGGAAASWRYFVRGGGTGAESTSTSISRPVLGPAWKLSNKLTSLMIPLGQWRRARSPPAPSRDRPDAWPLPDNTFNANKNKLKNEDEKSDAEVLIGREDEYLWMSRRPLGGSKQWETEWTACTTCQIGYM